MDRKNLIVAFFIALLAVGGSATLAWLGIQRLGTEPVIYTVVKGDTLFEIAAAHNVTVEKIREWNGIEGDLIEVGDQLKIFHPETDPTANEGKTTPRKRVAEVQLTGGQNAERPQLVMPDAKPCLGGPELSGTDDEQMAASTGLSRGQISMSMNSFLPNVLPCIHDAGVMPEEALMLEINVACTGLVGRVRVLQPGDWPPDVAECVSDVIGYTPFPAHALPDGETFTFPLKFAPE